MKSTFLLAVLISAVAAKAPTFIGFPKTLVCQNEDLTTFNVSGADVLVAVANGVSKANLLDPFGADDTSTAHCNNVAAPLYGVALQNTEVEFAYDEKTDIFTFCGAEEPLTNSFGYPNDCGEVY